MKMEYGYEYEYKNALETPMEFSRLYDNSLISQSFIYSNASEDLAIYKDLLILMKQGKKAVEYQQPSSLIKDGKGLGENQSLYPLNRENPKYSELTHVSLYQKVVNDFIFHSFHQMSREIAAPKILLEDIMLQTNKDYRTYPESDSLSSETSLKEFGDEAYNFTVQSNLKIDDTVAYRFDSQKNFVNNNFIKSLEFNRSVHINEEASFFNRKVDFTSQYSTLVLNKIGSLAETDTIDWFKAKRDVATYNNPVDFNKQVLFSIAQGIQLKRNNQNFYVEDMSAFSKLYDINFAKELKSLSSIKSMDIVDGFLVDYIPKDISVIDIAGMHHASEVMKNPEIAGLSKTTHINININKLETISRALKNIYIPQLETCFKQIKYVFGDEGTSVYKDSLDLQYTPSFMLSKAKEEILLNQQLFVNKGKEGVYLADTINIEKNDSKNAFYIDKLAIYKGDSKDAIVGNPSMVYKGATKDMHETIYDIHLVKDRKYTWNGDNDAILYKTGQADINLITKHNWFSGSKLKNFDKLPTAIFTRKDNNMNTGVDSSMITYIGGAKFMVENTWETVERPCYNYHVGNYPALDVTVTERHLEVLFDDLCNIHKNIPEVPFAEVIQLATRSQYLISLANKVEFLKNSEREAGSHEIVDITRITDRNVLLAMLGLHLDKFGKEMNIHALQLDMFKLGKQLTGEKQQPLGISKKAKGSINHNMQLYALKNRKNLDQLPEKDGVTKVYKEAKEIDVEDAIRIEKDSKDMINQEGHVNIDKISGEVDGKFKEMERFVNAIKDISDANKNVLKYLSKANDLTTLETVTARFSKGLDIEAEKLQPEWFVKDYDFTTNVEKPVGLDIMRMISELPFVEELVRDPIARDIVTMELPTGGTVDDEFIHDRAWGVDELLLPSEDFDYSKFKAQLFDYSTGQPINPVKKISDTKFIAKYPVDHAIGLPGSTIGRHYVDVDVYTLKFLLEMFYVVWQQRMFEFGTMDLRTGIQKMLKYMEIFIEYRIPPNVQEGAWRCYQLIRWYGEAVIMYNSTYEITFSYKPWKSELDTGIISCPHTLTDVIINSGYVLENTANHAEMELQQEVKKDGWIQFDARIFEGNLDVYLNTVKVETISRSKRFRFPIQEGPLNVRLEFNGSIMRIGNIVIDNCEFDDIVTEYKMEPGKANLGLDLVTKRICTYFEVTEANFDLMKEGIQGSLSLRDLSNRLVGYFNEHHQKKIKGKRLTIKKGML